MGLVYEPDDKFDRVEGFLSSAGTTVPAFTKQKGFNFALQYPLNLDTSPEYGGAADKNGVTSGNTHRVVFFINVSGNGKIAAKESGDGIGDYRTTTVALPENEFYKVSGSKLKDKIRDVPVVGNLNILKPMRRLNAAISLYVPNSLTQQYSVNWSEEDLTTGAIIDEAAGLLKNSSQSAATKEATQTWSGLVGQIAGQKILAGSNYLQKAARVSPGNSKVEQLFKGVDFRTFTFDYEFAPKSAKEAEAALQIIRMFRHHMLPEFADEASFMYIYPSEFDVRYYIGENENEHLEKQITSVLTNCTINYTPDGQFNTFANGMPTKIRMQLQFKELAVPTKETSPFDRQGI